MQKNKINRSHTISCSDELIELVERITKKQITTSAYIRMAVIKQLEKDLGFNPFDNKFYTR